MGNSVIMSQQWFLKVQKNHIYTYITGYTYIRISSNCVKLIFGKGHPSTLGVSRDVVFLVLLSASH